MFYKIKIAAILMVIGAISGLSIVGVHHLTRDRIAEERLIREFENYVEMFPDISIQDIETHEIVDDDFIVERIIVFNEDGDKLGEIYRGEDTNAFGAITVLVGIDMEGHIRQVIISSTENTPTYVARVPLENLSSQDARDITYDTDTGATATWTSVQRITNAAATLFFEFSDEIIIDEELEMYRTLFPDAEAYEAFFTFEDRAFVNETAIYDEYEDFIAFSYDREINGETVYLIVDRNDIFKGFLTIEDMSDALASATEAFDAYLDVAIGDIDPDVDGELEEALAAMIADLADITEDTTRINYPYLVRYENYYENDEHVGYLYTGWAQGFSGMTVTEVALDFDGAILHLDVVRHGDSPGYIGPDVIDNLGEFLGATDITQDEAEDTFAGATASGLSVYFVIDAAFNFHPFVEAEVVYGNEYLDFYQNYYENDDHVGYLYTGRSDGFSGTTVTQVALSFDGEILHLEILDHGDTPDYIGPIVIDNLDEFLGATDITQDEIEDTFAGATASGYSVYDVINEALQFHSERNGE